MADAIVRTLFRLFVSRRHLLEWVTAAQSKVARPISISAASIDGWPAASSLAAGAAVIVARLAPASWPIAAPFLIALARSPAVARWASLPPHVAGALPISDADARALRLDRAADLALLRDVRHGEPTTCCRRTTSRKIRSRSSPIGPRPPTSASICCRSSPPAISAGSARSTRSSASRRRSRPWTASSASAATSTTGTTRATCARWTRNTSRRSTAATSPAT